ncbi:MAG: hypothetical protein LBT29_09020 [Flavobacteriaceae bacterium]|nr:hypothetical protein [Flavobacteriaceae bacterium]
MHSLIQNSHIKTKHIISKSGIPEASFYRKLKLNGFSADEVLKILQIIMPEQYEYEEIMRKIKQGKEEVEAGNFIEEEDFVFDVRKRLGK